MITDLLLDVLHLLLVATVALLPTWTLAIPANLTTLVNTALAYDELLPIHECLAALTAFLYLGGATSGFKWAIKVIDYIADVIP